RGLVLWQSNGKSWKRSAPEVNTERLRPLGPPVQYRVTLEPSNKPWLLALDVPATTPDGARMRPGLTLMDNEPVRERRSYSVISYTRYATGALSPAEREAALAL